MRKPGRGWVGEEHLGNRRVEKRNEKLEQACLKYSDFFFLKKKKKKKKKSNTKYIEQILSNKCQTYK